MMQKIGKIFAVAGTAPGVDHPCSSVEAVSLAHPTSIGTPGWGAFHTTVGLVQPFQGGHRIQTG